MAENENALTKYVVRRGKAPVFEPPPGFRHLEPEEFRQVAAPWLEMVAQYFAEQGRKGGQIGGKSRSKSKIEAARENGRLGGRPKGSKTRRDVDGE